MQYQGLLDSIKRGVVSPVYLFCGEEQYLQEQLLLALKNALLNPELAAFNLEEIDGENCSLAQITESANALPVFAEKRLVIVKNAVFLQAGKKEAASETAASGEKLLLDYLNDPLLSTCLVFLVTGAVDNRRKLVKAIEKSGEILELKPLRGNELTKWLRDEVEKLGLKIEPRDLTYIEANAANSLRQLHNELEKLALYCQDEGIITLPAVEKMLTKSSEANIFALVDYLGEKKGERALKELSYLLEQGEPPVRILFMIARQYRLIIQAKELAQKGFSEKQITSELKTHPFVTGKLLRQARYYSFSELERILDLLLQCDVALKSRGIPKLTLEQLIIQLAMA